MPASRTKAKLHDLLAKVNQANVHGEVEDGPAVLNNLMALLNKLEHKSLRYTLAHHREDALMVCVAVPGERWEIEFLSDGSVEIEKFLSTGETADAQSLSDLFARYADQEEDAESSLDRPPLPVQQDQYIAQPRGAHGQ